MDRPAKTLRDSKEFLRSLFESAADAIAVVDREGRIVRVNRQAEALFGYSREELVGQSIDLLIPERFRERHGQYRSAYMSHPGTRPMGTGLDLTGRRRDGSEFSADVMLTPVETDQGPLIITTTRDITETRRLEEEARLRQRFEDLSRAKSAFIASMSHELRSPLNSIIGFADLLLHPDMGPVADKHVQHVQRIRTAGQHLLQLIGDILDLAKVEAGKIELRLKPLVVAEILEDILAIAQGLANQKSQMLQQEIAPDLPDLSADPVRFKQICFNLLSNAMKFTPPHGEIRLEARRAATNGNPLEIRVTDTGAGIRPEDLPRLFKEFTQLETTQAQHREGTGLGLAITKQLVELHGGRIWAESDGEGKGSTFTVVLPFGGPGAPVEPSAGPTHP